MTVRLYKILGIRGSIDSMTFYVCPLQSVLDSPGEHGQDIERSLLLIKCNIQIFQWPHRPL